MANWTMYRNMFSSAETSRDAEVAQARADFLADAPFNPAWMIATVRGHEVGMLVKASDQPRTKWFNAPHDADIKRGDLVVLNGVTWICAEMSDTDDVTLKGMLRECNLNLKFQVGTSDIYSCWCFFDKGVYSTTTEESPVAQTGAQQFKIILPYTNETKLLQRPKRLATEVLYYPDGTQHLRCYEITANDSVGSSFGDGRLLELKVKESQDNLDADNVDEMICDYIAPAVTPDPEDPGGEDDPGGGWW